MSLVVQITAATLTVAFLVFLSYALLAEGHRRPSARGPSARRRSRGAVTGSDERSDPDARAGGAAFRNEALAVADDPLRPAPTSQQEDRT